MNQCLVDVHVGHHGFNLGLENFNGLLIQLTNCQLGIDLSFELLDAGNCCLNLNLVHINECLESFHLGVVDAEGSIDLDTARNSAIEALGKAGGKVTMYGVTFDSTDIDALFEMARKYSDS